MKYSFNEESWKEYLHWHDTDKKIFKKINDLIKTISRSPYEGIGNPEALKHEYQGYWSRRINREHRLIYKVTETEIVIVKCRFHYRKLK
ncbi:MAG: Txe/YoeB family addiction module toxin [Flavobacteriaceae bacterium]|nr:Txe/YoeB family addiction module toxin [Flavobacteriaceae bacterium]